MKRLAAVLAAWGPAGVFLLALIDSAGLPIPAGVDALLLAAAALNPRAAYLAAALATVGSLIGSFVLFWIGRKGGQMYLAKHEEGNAAKKFQQWFARYGLITVFIPMFVPFIPLPAKVFVLSAGALGVKPTQFLSTVAGARIPRYFILAFLGAQLGPHAGDWLKGHVWSLVALAVAIAAGFFLTMRRLERTA